MKSTPSSSTQGKNKKRKRGKHQEVFSALWKAICDCKPRDEVAYFAKNQRRLAVKLLKKAQVLTSDTFSLITHGNFSKPGWQGRPPPKMALSVIVDRYLSSKIKKDLSTFYPLPYPMSPTRVFLFPVIILSSLNLLVVHLSKHLPFSPMLALSFFYCSTVMPWNDEQKIEFCDGIERLLAPQLNNPEVIKQC